MLEVRLHDTPAAFRLQLSGELAQGSVAEVALCWQTGSSTLGARRLVVDLTNVASIDAAGRELLERMSRAGAEFIATSPEMRENVRGITGRWPVAQAVAPGRRFPSLKRILTLLLCPILRCSAQRNAG
jgi:ABC-type transporter Mla MlaB component